MKKIRLQLLFALLLLMTGAYAQKIDQRLTNLVNQVSLRRAQGLHPIDAKAVNRSMAVDFNADGTIRAFSAIATLNKGAECPTAQLEQMGITVRYAVGNQAALIIPADKLTALEQIKEIRFVSADLMKQRTNDLARKETKADIAGDATRAIAAGLPKAYTGKGVVLGIIDDGIDFNHAAFRNADGSTRVKRAYVYSAFDVTNKKAIYKEYDETNVGQLTCDTTGLSHGTHTSATAGGSEIGNGFQGVAPEADLVLCGLSGYLSTSNINDALGKIFDYATSVNKPAVVSISLGLITGFHDGVDATAQLVGTLTNNGTKPGRAVLISSGNAAANWESIIKMMYDTTTELKTVLGASSVSSNGVIYKSEYSFYANDYKDFDIQLKVVNLKTGVLSDLGNHVLDLEGNPVTADDLLKPYGGQPRVTGEKGYIYYLETDRTSVKMDNSDYRLALVVKANSADQVIKMICAGDNNDEPCFDAPNREGEYNFAGAGFTKGNGDMAFNVTVCNNAVISVGSYITSPEWTNYKDKNYKYKESPVTGKIQKVGEISDFSGYGVDDNGRPHPTIIAPGQGIISAANNWDEQMFKTHREGLADEPGVPDEEDERKGNALATLISYVEKNNRRNWYVLEQGTSMSTPHAAGIVTLWMQADPNLSANQIMEILKKTCRNDDFTTLEAMIPSSNTVQAGMGKIDAVAGLKMITGSTGIETIEAGEHREATPATMYSVDAPVYNMMGQRVDKNTRGLVIYKGKKYLNK